MEIEKAMSYIWTLVIDSLFGHYAWTFDILHVWIALNISLSSTAELSSRAPPLAWARSHWLRF